MKKIVIGFLSAAFILGAGTYTVAHGNSDGPLNFGQMKPLMEKMHPDLSTKELKEMYDSCHGDKGMMQSKTSESMMNNL